MNTRSRPVTGSVMILLPRGAKYPNLRRRPPAPNKGRGRLQVQIRRAFIAANGGAISTDQIYNWAYTRRRCLTGKGNLSWSVLRILRQIAEPVGRAKTIGRPIIWKLRAPLKRP
jgi:hypothetical protein